MPNAAETASRDQRELLGQRLQEDAEGVDEQRREADEDADAGGGGDAPAFVGRSCSLRAGPGRWRRRSPCLGPRRLRLEDQLQRELHQPRRPGREDAAEVRRVEVGHRQAEVDVVEHVEHLGAELQPRVAATAAKSRTSDTSTLVIAGPARDVAAGVAELAGLRLDVEPLERGAADPRVDRVRPGVRIADQVRPAGGEARRSAGCWPAARRWPSPTP